MYTHSHTHTYVYVFCDTEVKTKAMDELNRRDESWYIPKATTGSEGAGGEEDYKTEVRRGRAPGRRSNTDLPVIKELLQEIGETQDLKDNVENIPAFVGMLAFRFLQDPTWLDKVKEAYKWSVTGSLRKKQTQGHMVIAAGKKWLSLKTNGPWSQLPNSRQGGQGTGWPLSTQHWGQVTVGFQLKTKSDKTTTTREREKQLKTTDEDQRLWPAMKPPGLGRICPPGNNEPHHFVPSHQEVWVTWMTGHKETVNMGQSDQGWMCGALCLPHHGQ